MARLGPSKDTLPERTVRAWLRNFGLRYRKNFRGLPGSPDAAVHSLRLAVFADGRHWHDPETAARHQRPYHLTDWVAKAKGNRRRDLRVNRELRALGWRVVRIWDSSISKEPERTRERLRKLLRRRLRRAVRL